MTNPVNTLLQAAKAHLADHVGYDGPTWEALRKAVEAYELDSCGIKAGDVVQFYVPSMGLCSDTVRAVVIQDVILQPYAPNDRFPIAILTEFSWVPVKDLTKIDA